MFEQAYMGFMGERSNLSNDKENAILKQEHNNGNSNTERDVIGRGNQRVHKERGNRSGELRERTVLVGEGIYGSVRFIERKDSDTDRRRSLLSNFKNNLSTALPDAEYVELFELEKSLDNAQSFYNYIKASREANKYGLYVSLYSVEEYADSSIRLFMSRDLSSGFAIKPDGDIVSVFSNKNIAAHKYSVYSILYDALENGGTKIDCYGKKLLGFYMAMGFEPQGFVAYNEEYEEADWTAQKEVLGSPNVYALYYNDSNLNTKVSNVKNRIEEYTIKRINDLVQSG